jgi:hypothetical protein
MIRTNDKKLLMLEYVLNVCLTNDESDIGPSITGILQGSVCIWESLSMQTYGLT